MTDPTTAATRLAEASDLPALDSARRRALIAATADGPTPPPGYGRGPLPSTAGAAIAGLVRDLGPYPYPAAPGPEVELDGPVEAPSPVDRVIDHARSALALLEDRLDALLVRLAPALSADPEDDDGRPMADPDDDPRSDLVIAIDRLGLTADRLSTRIRLTTERLDL